MQQRAGGEGRIRLLGGLFVSRRPTPQLPSSPPRRHCDICPLRKRPLVPILPPMPQPPRALHVPMPRLTPVAKRRIRVGKCRICCRKMGRRCRARNPRARVNAMQKPAKCDSFRKTAQRGTSSRADRDLCLTAQRRGFRMRGSRLRGNDGRGRGGDGGSLRVASPPPRFAALARPLSQTGGGFRGDDARAPPLAPSLRRCLRCSRSGAGAGIFVWG